MAKFKEGDVIVHENMPYNILLVFIDMYVCTRIEDNSIPDASCFFLDAANRERFVYLSDDYDVRLYDYGYMDLINSLADGEYNG